MKRLKKQIPTGICFFLLELSKNNFPDREGFTVQKELVIDHRKKKKSEHTLCSDFLWWERVDSNH